MKTPKMYTKPFFTNCILENNYVKTAFYTTVENSKENAKNDARHKWSC